MNHSRVRSSNQLSDFSSFRVLPYWKRMTPTINLLWTSKQPLINNNFLLEKILVTLLDLSKLRKSTVFLTSEMGRDIYSGCMIRNSGECMILSSLQKVSWADSSDTPKFFDFLLVVKILRLSLLSWRRITWLLKIQLSAFPTCYPGLIPSLTPFDWFIPCNEFTSTYQIPFF